MKSFEDINILIKMKLFCLKSVFFFKKRNLKNFKNIKTNCFFEKNKKKTVILEKKIFALKQIFFFEKTFFENFL